MGPAGGTVRRTTPSDVLSRVAGNGGPPESKTQAAVAIDSAAVAQLAGVLHSLITGVCHKLGVDMSTVVMALLCCIQKLLAKRQRRRDADRGAATGGSALAVSVESAIRVLMDTAATVPVVGSDLIHLARNIRPLLPALNLDTANGVVKVTEQCDLPAPHGIMDGALCVPSCARSLNPGVGTCAKYGFGLVIDDDGTGARYVKGGVTMLELDLSGGMFGFAPHFDSPDSVFCVSPELFGLHNQLLEAFSAVAYATSSPKFDIRQHLLDGHRHFSAECPWCVQARLRKKRAMRMPFGGRRMESGYGVSCDFSGPHEPDVDGFTIGFIAVEVRSSKDFVGLQTSRSTPSTLVSLKQCESELIHASGGSADRIVEFHHDDDTGFRGVVSEYATERGWRDTHTGGYNPNANSLAERRIGMLHQMFRTVCSCLLLVATYTMSNCGVGV